MNTYETTATVEGQGEVRVAGVPFAAGTEVEVTISRKAPTADEMTASEDAATAGAPAAGDTEDIFAEMQPYIATGSADVDDSREAMYTRLEGE